MSKQWTLSKAREWMIGKCVERYRAEPDSPVLHIPFHQPPSPDAPPDGLVLRAFRLLEEEGIVTGHIIGTDNTDAIWIRDLQLSDRAILELESPESDVARADRRRIGFT
jgi:hypothetical protein